MVRRVPGDRWAPWRRSTAGSLRAEFALLIGFLLVVGLLRLLGDSVVAGQLEAHARTVHDAERSNRAALQALTDGETGVRGYQLTGDPAFLEPYHAGVRDYPVELDRALAAAPTVESRRLLLVEVDAALDWLSRFGALAATVPAGHPDRQPGRSAEGKALFDRLRAANAAVVTALRAYEHQLISTFRLTSGIGEMVLGALSVLSALLALILGIRTSRLLVRPLERIRAGIIRFGGGDHTARVPEDGPPEIRILIRTINGLADELVQQRADEAARARLRVAALEVRSRVSQRLDRSGVLDEAAAAIGPALRTQRVYLYANGDDDSLPAACEWHGAQLWPVPLPTLPPEATSPDPVVRGDAGPDPAVPPPLAEYLRRAAATAYVFLPFGVGTPAAGGLVAVECAGPRAWSAEELTFLEAAGADLTRALDQVRLDEQQQELVDRLRDLNRRRTEFVNLVSHDLRGPLTSILSYTEDIADEDDGRLTDHQRTALAVITRNTRRLTGMADELLTLARAESATRPLEARPVRLVQLATDVIAAMEPAARAGGLTLTCEVPGDLWVEGDPAQLERALLNLVSNAVKFTPPGGQVGVTASERVTGGVQLSVRDTGIGIPEQERAALFEPFRRARNAAAAAIPGTGLGLAVVRAVVHQHHGTVAMESTEGAGTVITITLPACPADRRGEPAGRS